GSSMKPFVLALFVGAASVAYAAGPTLLDAVEQGDRAAALRLIQKGANPNLAGADGTTHVMWAATNDDVELVRALVKAGANVNAKNHFGTTALTEASIIGSAPVINVLVKAGADPNTRNPEGETPLMAAARSGKLDAAKVLIEAGADVNAKETFGEQTALMWAAAESQAEMVKLLVSKGADVDARGIVRNWERKVITEPRPKDLNQGGFTPMIYAAREGCTECAKYLVAGGADLNIQDPHGDTPLLMSMMNMHFAFAKFMVEAGADVNTLPTKGNGAMAVLPSEDNVTALDVATLMLDKGANPNIQLKRRPPYRDVPQDRSGDVILAQGATPLLRAARAGDAPFVELLIKHGALVDLPSKEGVTPLMAAAGVEFGTRVTRGRNRTDAGILTTMKLLVDAGANVNARMVNEAKREVFDASAAQANVYAAGLRGRPSQIPTPDAVPDQTAIMGAAERGYTPFVKFLLDHGADLSLKDASGRTTLDLAKGVGVRGVKSAVADPHPETVAAIEAAMNAKPAVTGGTK